MSAFVINGGRRLNGSLSVQGAKNSVLPILAATLLVDGKCEGRRTCSVGVGNRENYPAMCLVFFNLPCSAAHCQRANAQAFPVAFLCLVVFRWNTECVKFEGLVDECCSA